jgi:phasin
MVEQFHPVVAVAPMQPAGPCFATPIFRDMQTDTYLFQRMSANDRIDGFEEIAEGAEGRFRYGAATGERTVGQAAFFAYLTLDNKIYIAEKIALGDILRREFDLHRGRVHLRRSIAAFLNEPELVATTQAEVDAWRRVWQPRSSDTIKSEIPKFDLPKLEAPAALREFAEKGVSQARENYTKFKDAAEAHNRTIEAVFATASKGASEYSAKLMEFINTNTSMSLGFAEELIAAKSLPDLLELSNAHARKQVETITAQAQELAALAQRYAVGTEEGAPKASVKTPKFQSIGGSATGRWGDGTVVSSLNSQARSS